MTSSRFVSPFRVLVFLCAALGCYWLGMLGYAEVQNYRATKEATAQMFRFLSEQVGTRKTEDGKDAPLNRADVLALLAAERLKAAQAAPSTPPVK